MVTRSTLTRRHFLRLSTIGAAGAMLAACVPAAPAPAAPAAEGAPAAAEKVAIEFWWGWTPDLIVKAIQSSLDEFMKNNPTIEVKTAQHEWGEKLLTAYAAGTPPDIHEHWLPMQFAARDLLQPLDDRINASTVITKDLFPDVFWTVGTWNGVRYIVPSLAFFAETALISNPVVFEKAGLKVPDDIPSDWDVLFEQAKKHTKFDDAGNIDTVWMVPDKGLRFWPAMYGIEDYDEQEHKWRFDDPAWEEVVLNIARFYTEFGPEKIDAFFQAYPGWIAVPGSAFASDRQAMVISGYWIPGELDKNAPGKEFIYTWAPSGGAAKGKKVTHWGAHSVMIPKASKHPDQSWLLVEHFAGVKSAELIFENLGWIAPQKTFWDVMNVSRYRGLDFFVNHLAREAEINTVNSPSPAIAFAMSGFATDVVDAVIFGNKDVKTALADFQKAVTEEEAKFFAQ